MKKIFSVLLTVGLFLTSCSNAYSSEGEYNALKGDYEKLSKEYASLKEDYEELSTEYVTLSENYVALKKEIDSVKSISAVDMTPSAVPSEDHEQESEIPADISYPEDVTIQNAETSAKEYTFQLISFNHAETVELESIVKTTQTAPDGYEYAIFIVKTNNISENYTNLPSYDFYANKKKLSTDVRGGSYDGYNWFLGAIAPGMESTNYIILEVPIDWVTIDLYFLTDYGASKSALSVSR